MALVTQHHHQLQGPFCTHHSTSQFWGNGTKLRPRGVSLQVGLATGRSINKCKLHISLGTPRKYVMHKKISKISAFQGNAHSEESQVRASSSKSANDSVRLSYVQQDSDETCLRSSKPPNVPLSYATEAKDSLVGLPAVRSLFKKWLTMLVSQSPNGKADGILEQGNTETEPSEIQNVVQEELKGEFQAIGRSGPLKTVWGYFLCLDASIKLPLVIFVPFYLAVNALYGMEVTRQLTPLWVLGPTVVAVYVKLTRLIFALYVFSFKMSVIFLKNLPSYLQIGFAFIFQGGIQAAIYKCFFQPIVEMKNGDHRAVSIEKQKQFQEWSNEKFLDMVEAIWPFYCRTKRFLKRANLI